MVLPDLNDFTADAYNWKLEPGVLGLRGAPGVWWACGGLLPLERREPTPVGALTAAGLGGICT